MKSEKKIRETIELAKNRIKMYKINEDEANVLRWNDFVETLEWVLEEQ